jgi:hypothetical protein
MTFELLHPVMIEWGSLLVRWLHVITAIAWIGSSFYFMHLDASLRAIPEITKGGETWEVHGGGFYQVRKYLVAPDRLPEDLIWHKWQSYSTWLSGFFLLIWVYYAQSEIYLIDPAVRELTPFIAAAIGIGALAIGWLIYDQLSRTFYEQDNLLAVIGLALIMLFCFTFQQVFSGRGALLHTGAVMATWMTANVFMVIIPNQKKVIASLMKGETPVLDALQPLSNDIIHASCLAAGGLHYRGRCPGPRILQSPPCRERQSMVDVDHRNFVDHRSGCHQSHILAARQGGTRCCISRANGRAGHRDNSRSCHGDHAISLQHVPCT